MKVSEMADGAAGELLRPRVETVKLYLATDRDNPHLVADLLGLLLASGETQPALEEAERVLALHPRHQALRAQLSSCYIAQGGWDRARALLAEVVACGDAQPALVYNLAYIDYAAQRYSEAAALLRASAATLEQIPPARRLLARCLHHGGDLDGAIALLRTHLAAHAGDCEAMGLLGLVFYDIGQEEQALQWAMQAITGAPRDLAALVALGSLALAQEQPARATDMFSRALEIKADSGRAWLGLALADLSQGKLEAARRGLELAEAYMPSHVGTRLIHGWCRLMQNELPAAAACFDSALRLDGAFSEAHGSLAIAQVLLEQKVAGRASVERALRLDPLCLSARYAQALLEGRIRDMQSFQAQATQLLQLARHKRHAALAVSTQPEQEQP
ncbi:MAG TPA: tetratricopeptide repeat protein [Burkholderiaceae bacterium]